MSKEQRIQAIETAVDRGGGIVRFAKALGVTHQAVYSWKKRGWAPADKALIMETLFSVPRSKTSLISCNRGRRGRQHGTSALYRATPAHARRT